MRNATSKQATGYAIRFRNREGRDQGVWGSLADFDKQLIWIRQPWMHIPMLKDSKLANLQDYASYNSTSARCKVPTIPTILREQALKAKNQHLFLTRWSHRDNASGKQAKAKWASSVNTEHVHLTALQWPTNPRLGHNCGYDHGEDQYWWRNLPQKFSEFILFERKNTDDYETG